MPARKKLIAKVNIVGPDGSLVTEGEQIPAEWLDDPEFDADHLVASGGAKKG